MGRDKTPLQVYLEQHQLEALRFLAQKKETSMTELVRESIAEYLARQPIEDDPALGLIGLGQSGQSDIAEKHDQYLTSETHSAETSREQAEKGDKDGHGGK